MVARALARPDSAVMAMIGAGSQAEFQALAVRAVLGIDRLRVWDVDAAAIDKLVRNLAPLGFEIERATSASDAAAGADIVTTCTADKAAATVLSVDDVRPGMHLNAIGGDCPARPSWMCASFRSLGSSPSSRRRPASRVRSSSPRPITR